MKLIKRQARIKFTYICFLATLLGALNNFGQSSGEFDKKKISAEKTAPSNQNKPQPNKYKIKKQVFPYKIGDKVVKIVVGKTSAKVSEFVYFNMHDNENTAVEATEGILEKFGGTLIELQNDGERLIKFSLAENQFTFDPNRIFTPGGIKKTLQFNSADSFEAEGKTRKFAEKLESFLKNARLIIAVHNNTDENYSIASYAVGGEFEKDAKLSSVNAKTDVDDFFYVNESNFFKFLKGKNQNVALQDNEKVTDDGSLAVYCARNKISYINVESEHGHLTQQTKMLEVLQNLIKKFVRAGKKVRRK